MLVIAFEPGVFVGGYGDRVVGLLAVYLLAKLLKQEFRILWTKEDISASIDLGKYRFQGPVPPNTPLLDTIDSKDRLSKLLRTSPNPFPQPLTILRNNQEISHHLYTNPKFRHESFLLDILIAYDCLYTEILRPTPALVARAEAFKPADGRKQIGIQIRCGDVYMKTTFRTNHCVIQDAPNTVPALLAQIKRHIEQTYSSYTVFVTSDWRGAIQAAKEIFESEDVDVRGVDEEVQHLDRPQVAGLDKIFLDNYVLATNCSRLYISLESNYGRIAALASPAGTELFDLNAIPLTRSLLISKETLQLPE